MILDSFGDILGPHAVWIDFIPKLLHMLHYIRV